MNCYNGEKYLKKSISSVINQTYKNWELIFWDNKSTDRSEKIFKDFTLNTGIENAFGEDYEEAFGYSVQPFTAYARLKYSY